MLSFTFDSIGTIETCFPERFGTPRQGLLAPASWGILRLRPDLNLADGLDGLSGFSHVWLIFVFHQNTNKTVKTKIHAPRLDGGRTGVFATRSPHRPNPIGLTAARLERIEGDRIHLSGIDLVDGTPILDIKPYVPDADRLEQAHGGWTEQRPQRVLDVQFSREALDQIAEMDAPNSLSPLGFPGRAARLRAMIEQVLALDPRPGFYKGTESRPNPYTDLYGFYLEDLNIRYRMTGTTAEVLTLERYAVPF